MDDSSSGVVTVLAIALCICAFVIAKIFFPSLFVFLLWIIGIVLALVIVLIGVVLYFAFKKPKAGEEETAKSKANKVVSEGRNKVMSIRRSTMSIRNTGIKNAGIKVCSAADKILDILRREPKLLAKNRQFFTYYLPTLGSIIKKYAKLEKNGLSSTEMEEKVLKHLNDIKTAFDKQYESLFAGDMLDLSVEIEAMTIACKRDGLLSDADFEKDKEISIDLEF